MDCGSLNFTEFFHARVKSSLLIISNTLIMLFSDILNYRHNFVRDFLTSPKFVIVLPLFVLPAVGSPCSLSPETNKCGGDSTFWKRTHTPIS